MERDYPAAEAEEGEVFEEGEIADDTSEGDIQEEINHEERIDTKSPTNEEESQDDTEMDAGEDLEGTENIEGPADANLGDTTKEQATKAKEPAHKPQSEVTYSTRGRAAENLTDPLDRLANESMAGTDDVGMDLAIPSANLRESFLSDSLTEEERRTRTRYIPNVSGMHALRKHEVKGDLSLARALQTTASGVTANLNKRKTASRRGSDDGANADNDGDAAMSLDDVGTGGSVPPSEDERMSDIIRLGGRTIRLGTTDYSLPSSVFVAPPTEKPQAKDNKIPRRSPREVEYVAAFDPPRPPESVGAKKKHRLLRWERSPSDIEVDLNNYRKTVQRTQQELCKTQDELNRIQTVENQLRGHFLHYLRNINEEMNALNQELAAVQQECVKEADLLSTRTRNRGAGKGNVAMRDVLNVLKARGDELKAKGYNFESYVLEESKLAKGAGGVGAANFANWDSSTLIQPEKIASAWIVPGEKVVSPYGEGNVVVFHPSDPLTEKKSSSTEGNAKESDGDTMDIDSSSPVGEIDASLKNDSAPEVNKKKSPAGKVKEKSGVHGVRSPRIGVQLPYGVAYFPLETLKITEDPALLSDERLAARWKEMHETAKAVAPVLDLAAMACVYDEDDDKRAESTMETDESDEKEASSVLRKRRLLPFGAELLPSAHGRGNLLLSKSIEELEKAIEHPLFDGHGVVGIRNNRSVPKEMAVMESLSEDKILLQAKVNHLRNKLQRQRRIRVMNERTLGSTQERAAKVESFVLEMRSDLKSLKMRLSEEIRELGVTEEQATAILASYSGSLHIDDLTEGTPSKRQRMRSDSNVDAEGDMEDDFENRDAGDVVALEVKQ
ncbi:hypothetical protein FisN_7Lh130 [Fistulifera solaris]|uniref:Uncharacterized protein n=1 Tax=Fistulifera solaris TaxID=1519565 RepID=A0A1Z5JDB0_FISSO|nr:hypothetical protein FisN_7Lh130 [Fistulifera solaris]|eukprot:GAX11751.1 hypothetical protein FisN_7Lh130 [Fistulifera solaris]